MSALKKSLVRLQAEDGSWPHKLDVRNASTSIVSTAQVVEMLRLCDYEYDAPEIQSGLTYLAREVKRHTQPMSPSGPGRGDCARFPVFALWGLTRYHRAIADRRFEDGIAFAIKWLSRNELPEGGWAVQRGVADLSFTMTTPAIHALDRLRTHHRHGDDASRLTHNAREAFQRRANLVSGCQQAWWTPYDEGADPSAAATILAVLALTNGPPTQRDLARQGANWLMAHPECWVTGIEPDRQLDDRQWSIMSFSLGLRALLHPRIGIQPTNPTLRPAIQHLSGLWVDEKNGWAVIRGWRPTTTGCFAVVSAVHALKRAFDFDPEQHLLGFEPEAGPEPPPARSPLAITLSLAEQHVLIEDQAGECLVSCNIRGGAQWRVLVAIAKQHLSAQDDEVAQAIPVEALAARFGVKPSSVARTVRRVNEKLSDEATMSGCHLQGLIEHVVAGDTTQNRYGFEQVEEVILREHAPDRQPIAVRPRTAVPADRGHTS
jgi:hypothetical protein